MFGNIGRVDEDAALLRFGPDFDEKTSLVESLWHSEVETILENEVNRIKKDKASGEQPSPMILQTLAYAKKFSNYRNKEAVAPARQNLKKAMEGEDSPYRDIWHYEIACLNNLNVMSVDEALSLVPSLNSLGERIAQRKGLSDPESINVEEIIKNLLEDIKRFQMQ